MREFGYWQCDFLSCSSIFWCNNTAWVHGVDRLCRPESQPRLATGLTARAQTALFPPTTPAVIQASYDFPVQTRNSFLFFSMMTPLIWPQVSFAGFVKGFPHSPLSMWGSDYFGSVPRLYKDERYCPIWAFYTNTIQQQVWEEYFFLSAEGCYFRSVWGKCERTKVAGKGAFIP